MTFLSNLRNDFFCLLRLLNVISSFFLSKNILVLDICLNLFSSFISRTLYWEKTFWRKEHFKHRLSVWFFDIGKVMVAKAKSPSFNYKCTQNFLHFYTYTGVIDSPKSLLLSMISCFWLGAVNFCRGAQFFLFFNMWYVQKITFL